MAQQPGNQPQGFGMQPGGIPPGANLAPTPFQSARNGVSPVGAGHGFADQGQPKDIQMTDASPSQTGANPPQTQPAPPSAPSQFSLAPQASTPSTPATIPSQAQTQAQTQPQPQQQPQAQPSAASPLPGRTGTPGMRGSEGAPGGAGASRSASAHPADQQGPDLPAEAAAHGAAVRQYINGKVTTVLMEGMKIIAKEQPKDPLRVLGEFLLRRSKEIEGPGP